MAKLQDFIDVYTKAVDKEISFEQFLEEMVTTLNIEYLPEGSSLFDKAEDYVYSWCHPSGNTPQEIITTLQNLEELLFEEVEVVGGGEGDGEHYHIVYKVLPYDCYIKQDANYQSYYGINCYDKIYEVSPQPVTTIEYLPV